MESVAYPHLEIRSDQVAYIAGTQIKVLEIALDRLSFHWDADEIQRQHPELTLAQIYSALAYYYDHQQELDGVIEERLRREEAIFSKLPASQLSARLKASRRLS